MNPRRRDRTAFLLVVAVTLIALLAALPLATVSYSLVPDQEGLGQAGHKPRS